MAPTYSLEDLDEVRGPPEVDDLIHTGAVPTRRVLELWLASRPRE
jgi:hypothetical protein